jgi:hypothetical protein
LTGKVSPIVIRQGRRLHDPTREVDTTDYGTDQSKAAGQQAYLRSQQSFERSLTISTRKSISVSPTMTGEGIAFDIFLNSYSWPLQWLCLKSRIMSQLMRQIGTEYIEGSTRQLDQGHSTSRDQVQHPVLDSIEAVATTILLRYLLQPSHKLNH